MGRSLTLFWSHNSQIAANWCDNSRTKNPRSNHQNIKVLQDILTPPIKPHLGITTNINIERLSHRHWRDCCASPFDRWVSLPCAPLSHRGPACLGLTAASLLQERAASPCSLGPGAKCCSPVCSCSSAHQTPAMSPDAAGRLIPTPLWLELSRIFTSWGGAVILPTPWLLR